MVLVVGIDEVSLVFILEEGFKVEIVFVEILVLFVGEILLGVWKVLFGIYGLGVEEIFFFWLVLVLEVGEELIFVELFFFLF